MTRRGIKWKIRICDRSSMPKIWSLVTKVLRQVEMKRIVPQLLIRHTSEEEEWLSRSCIVQKVVPLIFIRASSR